MKIWWNSWRGGEISSLTKYKFNHHVLDLKVNSRLLFWWRKKILESWLVWFFFFPICHSFSSFWYCWMDLLPGGGVRTLWSYMTKPQWLGQERSGEGLGGPARQDYRRIPLLAFILCLSSLLGIEHVEWLPAVISWMMNPVSGLACPQKPFGDLGPASLCFHAFCI